MVCTSQRVGGESQLELRPRWFQSTLYPNMSLWEQKESALRIQRDQSWGRGPGKLCQPCPPWSASVSLYPYL